MKCRDREAGAGVVLYVSNEFEHQQITKLSFQKEECLKVLIVQVKLNKNK